MYFFQNRFFRLLCFCMAFLLLLTAPFSTMTKDMGVANAFSVGEEKEVGEKLLSIVRKEFKLLDDPDIAQYINNLGKEILTTAGPQYFNYHFFVINNKEFNAFAAPSGLIFIHSGLIDITESEGELYSVMAHEVGHAASRHISDRIAKSSKLNIATAALLIAGIAIGGDAGTGLIAGSQAAGATMGLQFSRQDEEESDRLAYKWMKAQDRNPETMVSMLHKMRKVSRYRRGMVPAYLLTHPEPENRIGYVDDLIAMDQNRQYPPKDEFEFQRIKYRVRALTGNHASLLPIFLKKISDETTNKQNRLGASYGLSQIYLANRNFIEAREALHKLMIEYPNKPILTTDLGITYFQSGQYTEALKLFQKAMDANPDCTYTIYYYAQALQKTGNLSKALSYYEDLIETLPDYSKLYHHVGQLKADQGSPETGHYYLGIYFWLEGDSKTAKFHLNESIKKLPENNAIRLKAQEMIKKIERLEKS